MTDKIEFPQKVETKESESTNINRIMVKIEEYGDLRSAFCENDAWRMTRQKQAAAAFNEIRAMLAAPAVGLSQREGTSMDDAISDLAVELWAMAACGPEEGFGGRLDRMEVRLREFLADQKRAEEWQPMETAPKDGTPILALCKHTEEAYYDGGRLTAYGARAEGLSHVEDGPHVIVWGEAYEVSDGWESFTIPAGWDLSHDCEVSANPVGWVPVPDSAITKAKE